MEYSNLLDRADECEDPYLRLVFASEYAFPLKFSCDALQVSFFESCNSY